MKYLGRNTLSILGIAAVTMLATLAFMGPNGVQAEDGEDAKNAATLAKVSPEISTPKLEEDNCTITLTADKETYTVGDKPVLTFTVKNDSDKEVVKSVKVSMFARDLESRGRMPAMAIEVWTKTTEVTLAAGETKTVTLETGTAIAEHNATSFRMSGATDVLSKEAKLRKAVEEVARRNTN
ncbi:MAG: hypothetical protein K8I27_03405 [Planctomycetes bacterium]|nr:hypothetical protein [Planctomycetota bacterium]